jgi:hypothetical protein
MSGKVHHLVPLDLVVGEPENVANGHIKKRRPRRPTLSSVAKQVSQAAIEVARYDVKPDGTISIVPGKPTNDLNQVNPWDAVLPHERH